MLSRDQKAYVDTFQYYNGMINVSWLAGYLRRGEEERSFSIQQTNNLNHALPVALRQGDVLPGRFKDLSRLKVTCRVTGRKLENGERVAVLEVLGLDVPTVLDMPPTDQWNYMLPEGVPGSDFKPSEGGTVFSKNSNVVKIAGYVCGVAVEPAGSINEKGNVSSGCLKLLIAQKGDFDNAIPVRIYGKLAEAQADRLRLGMPILIDDGEFRIRVKETGEAAGEDGVKPVAKYPYVQAKVVKLANRDVMMGDTPQWAVDLANIGRANRRARGVSAPTAAPTAAPAAPAAAPAQDAQTMAQIAAQI